MAEREKLIELKDLQITFGSGKKKFVAVDHVNFDIYKGETFSLVGESGSGKTTIGRAICRINPTSGGDILFKGQKIYCIETAYELYKQYGCERYVEMLRIINEAWKGNVDSYASKAEMLRIDMALLVSLALNVLSGNRSE